ncbi:MAG: MaoC/PaaZ C-terminal domain-containing protein [Ramlibacter sp.]
MALDPHRLLAREFAPMEQAYTARDSILYALGVGLGADPLDVGQLRYLYEGAPGGLQALPAMVNVLGYPGFWPSQPDTGITWKKLLHAEQSFVLHRPLPAQAQVIGRNRVVALHDKGSERGALMVQRRELTDAGTGDALVTVTLTAMLRADGGFGGAHGEPLAPPHVLPERAPDHVCDLATLRQAALLYRLSGDYNTVHADPVIASQAGFPRPILHGLCTMGVAMHAILKSLLAYDASSVRAMRVRFTAPVFPGETIRTEIWRDGSVVSFRSSVLERNVLVLGAGRVDLDRAAIQGA